MGISFLLVFSQFSSVRSILSEEFLTERPFVHENNYSNNFEVTVLL